MVPKPETLGLERPKRAPTIDLSVRFPAEESRDWGFARTKRSVLMVPSAEWVQSVFSCQFDLNGRRFVAPNRDYAYEGLCAHQEGENWKFIDSIAISCQDASGRYCPAIESQSTVDVSPFRATYNYAFQCPGSNSGAIPISASYYLHSQSAADVMTSVFELSSPSLEYPAAVVTIKPFVDVRHMFAGSDFDNYTVERRQHGSQQAIHITNYNRALSLYFPLAGELIMYDNPEVLPWFYKLGTGSRKETLDKENQKLATNFVGERKNVAAFFEFRPDFEEQPAGYRLFMSCGLVNKTRFYNVGSLERIHDQSQRKDERLLHQLSELPPVPREYRKAMLGRMIGLTKFKTLVLQRDSEQASPIPHAGGWWFKTPWFRDVFEGLMGSFNLLMSLPDERDIIKQVLSLALSAQHPQTGLIPNRIPEYSSQKFSYNSSDATLMCFITACRYLGRCEDRELEEAVIQASMKTILAFLHGADDEDGPPAIDSTTALLRSVPHHSWIDTRAQCLKYCGEQMENLPSRVSPRFIKDLYDQLHDAKLVEQTLCSPRFYLPEINAQWITMLRGLRDVVSAFLQRSNSDVAEEFATFVETISTLCDQAEAHFVEVFWNEDVGYLYNVVFEDRQIKDEVECESAVTAAAMLNDSLFSRGQLEAIWKHVQKCLLVYRRPTADSGTPRPFGILTKNDDQRVFYDDKQYHCDVVWLRSTHYLVGLLRLLGEETTVQQLLRNVLDHQMSEAAIFYSQELFSRPCGNNCSPVIETANNPVPVKNPIQFWSQWCDHMIDVLGKEEWKSDASDSYHPVQSQSVRSD